MASPAVLKALWEKRQQIITQLQANAALYEGREPTAEERSADEALEKALAEVDEKIEKGLDTVEREQRASKAFERYEGLMNGGVLQDASEKQNEVASGLRQFLRGEKRSWEYELDSRVSSAYDLETRSWEERALLETTGGMPLPRSFSGQLYEAFIDAAGVVRAKQGNDSLYITTSGEPLDVPRALVHGASGGWFAENVVITGTDPTLSFITLNAYKAGHLIQVSRELVDDEGFDIVGYLARAAGRNIGLTADAGYVVGTGAGAQPTGFQPNATVAVTGPVGTTVSLGTQATAGQGSDLLVDLMYSVLEPYADRGVWMMNRQSVAKVARLKGTGGEVIWQPALSVGQPDTLLGRPIVTDPNMPVMAANAKSIAFGDFNGYAVRIVRGVRFERSDEFAFSSDMVTFKAVLRTDGKLLDTNAIKLFQNSAT